MTTLQASVQGRDLPISTKHTIEICNFIKGKSLQQSKRMLQEVMDQKIAVPFKIYKRNVGHKPGHMAAGRYPYKASQTILKLLQSLEANAENKGMNITHLHLTMIMPNRAPRPFHAGRHRGIKQHRTHIKIVAEERTPNAQKPEAKKPKEETK